MTRRALASLFGLALTVLGISCSASSVPSQGTTDCRLTEVKGSTSLKDILSGVTPARGGVMVVGTRYVGSGGSPMSGGGTTSSWRTHAIPTSKKTSMETGQVGGAATNVRWAVGTIGQTGVMAPLILSWNGRAWTQQAAPDPGTLEDGLSGVAAVSRTNAWAVGRHGTPTGFRTLVERWNGSAWTVTPSANLGNSDALNDVAVASPGAAWAVGWSVQGQRYATLALRWNGSRWSVVATPHFGAGDAVLYGVAIAPSGAWAVGWISRGDQVTPVVERWTGHAWKVVKLPSAFATAAFSDIAVHGGEIAIVGRGLADGHSQPLVVVRKAGHWLEVPVDHSMGHGSLSAVTVDPSGRIWAVGVQDDGNGQAASLVVSGC